ncbi:hypothetical protein PCG10_004671 [Penicillium crustosum]|uniref:RanBD1 domain-containing protein n=1 Tax=Penicillium crustosum TaxID=36656 RepID=A0A9P5L5A2_PENCR|nr:uncharacterized protein N7487_010851 [Penicillium crustosum]KAF7525680.1 hypothetical protein PCG10_004671 [Penicillium crustosum]KAJ5393210.1 hypothetical protein N7487_010851 [Penicillium crustosum]
MLKRGAQGPQGSKEDEGIFGMASTPDDKPHRATAAQLASRKIKDVRKRRAPTPTTGGGAPGAASFNPFASVAPAAAPAPTQSTGFTFGQTQSQSFPGASSGPSQGGIFSSGTNGQAGGQASFSFGAGPTTFGSAPPSNPFAVNTSFGGNTQSSTNGFSFGGFNAGNQSTPSFGGFGAQQNTSTPAKPVLFGQSAAHITSPADDSMQTSPDTKPKGGSMFSPKLPAGPSALGNPFSNLSGENASSNPFAPKTVTAEKPADKPAETQPFKPLFGSTPAASKPVDAEKPTASNPFANLSGQAPTSSTNLFAPKTTAAEQTPAKPAEAAKPFGALFGSTPSSQPSGPATNLFAPKPAAEEPKASNPFANLSAPKVTGTESSVKTSEEQPFKSMFGTPAASKGLEAGKEQAATPAFGNMFSPKPVAEGTAATPAADQPFKSLFGTPAVSKVSDAAKEQTASPAFGNMFSPKPVAESTPAKPSEDKPFKPMFGTPVAEKEQLPASSVFAPKVTSEEQTPLPAKVSPFGSMFGASPAPSPAPSKLGEEKATQPTPSNPFANLSGQNAFSNPFAPKPTEQAATPQAPSTSLFGASTAADNNKDNNIPGLNGSLTSPFTAEPKVSSEPPTEGATKPATPHVSFAQSPRDHKIPSSSSLPSSSSNSTVSNTFTASNPDSLFPRPDHPVSIEYPLSTEDFDEMPLKRLFPEKNRDQLRDRANLLMKIGVLTESFKREIAKCDPMTDDIDEVIILYAELRRELGVPIGSINPEEEAKRAAINERDAAEEAADGNATPPTFVPPAVDNRRPEPSTKPSGGSTTSSKFAQSFSAPAPAPATASAGLSSPAAAPVATAPVARAEPSPSTASPAATPAPPSAVEAPKFGGAATSTTAPAFQMPKFGDAATSAAPPAFQIPKFGDAATSAATSAAAPAFKIPSFGAPATGANFMAQFKSKSDSTIADAKAKRKAEEFDSDEEDEAEWERKDEERQRAKRAEIEAAAKKRAVFVPGEGFKFVDDDTAPQNVKEPATSATPATPAQDDSAGTVNSTPNIFPPFVSPSTASTKANGTPSVSSSNFQPGFPKSSSPQSSEFSTLVGTATRSPADAALFGGKPGGPPSLFGASAPSSSINSSVFGTSSKPVPASQNIFGGLKPTSPKRKASADESDDDDDSPAKKPKSSQNIFGGPNPAPQNIFGAPKPTSPKRKASVDESNNHEDSSAKQTKSSPPPPSVGASMFGRVSTTPLAPSINSSAQPVMSAPSTATEDEEGEPGEIFDLTKGNGGEEEETVMFEDKSRVFKLEDKWVAKGTGPVRVLKHPVTGRARIVARAEPSGNVTLNILLKKEFDYKLTTNSVQFLVPNETGTLTHWAVRVKGERLREFHQLVNDIKN